MRQPAASFPIMHTCTSGEGQAQNEGNGERGVIADSKRFGIGAMSGISGAARAVRMALEAGKWLVAYADNLMRLESVAETGEGHAGRCDCRVAGLVCEGASAHDIAGPRGGIGRTRGGLKPRKKACKNFWSWATVIKASASNVV